MRLPVPWAWRPGSKQLPYARSLPPHPRRTWVIVSSSHLAHQTPGQCRVPSVIATYPRTSHFAMQKQGLKPELQQYTSNSIFLDLLLVCCSLHTMLGSGLPLKSPALTELQTRKSCFVLSDDLTLVLNSMKTELPMRRNSKYSLTMKQSEIHRSAGKLIILCPFRKCMQGPGIQFFKGYCFFK